MAAGYDGSIRIDTKVDGKGFNTGVKQINKGLGGITTTLKSVAAAVGIAFGVAAIVNFSKASVKASTELTNAMTGLRSIMEGQGRSFSKSQKFINDYVSDGLIPATEAINAYKNLALRGYDDTQIQQVLVALKDSAAFGRQASLTMGEAIRSATEGLKNENSILVDNAGVTKNVSMMWKDYARSIGVGVDSLTKQQKIQAEVLGIMEETKFQTGDATKIAESYSGQVLRLGYNFNNLKIAVGNALIPIAQAVLPGINAIIEALTRLANIFAQVSTAIFGKQAKQQEQVAKAGVKAANSQKDLAKATDKAGKAAKNSIAGFDELNVLAEDMAESPEVSIDGLGTETVFGSVGNSELGADVTVSPQVEAAIEKIKNLLLELKSYMDTYITQPFMKVIELMKPILSQFIGEVVSTFKVLYSEVKKIFTLLWTEGIKPALDIIIRIWGDLYNSLFTTWNKHGISIFTEIRKTFVSIGELFKSVWENILKPVWDNFMQTIDWLWTKHLKPLLENFLSFASEFINGALKVVEVFVEKFGPPIALVFNTILDVISTVIGAAIDIISGIITTLKGIVQFITGVFTGDWAKAWEGVVNIFKGIFEGIGGIVKGVVNLVIDLINGMISAVVSGVNYIIKKINDMSFKVPDWVPGIGGNNFGFNIPEIKTYKIPKLATGAVIPPNSEFMAILGDQKSGRNIEAPEGLIRQIIREELDGFSGSEEINITMPVYLSNEKVYEGQKKVQRRRGKSLVEGAM